MAKRLRPRDDPRQGDGVGIPLAHGLNMGTANDAHATGSPDMQAFPSEESSGPGPADNSSNGARRPGQPAMSLSTHLRSATTRRRS